MKSYIYSFKELSDSSKARVIAQKADQVSDDWTSQEIMASIKAICGALNLKMLDWSIGTYNQNWKLKISNYHVEDLSGGRALAWFYHKIKEHGYEMRPLFTDDKRWHIDFPGVCGFTGACWDDNVLESIWNSLRAGNIVKEAFNGVAYDAGKWLEAEEDYQKSEECILQYLDQNEEIYDEDGNEI